MTIKRRFDASAWRLVLPVTIVTISVLYWPSSTSGQTTVVALVGAVSVHLIRAFRVRVTVGPGRICVCNTFRTRSFALDEATLLGLGAVYPYIEQFRPIPALGVADHDVAMAIEATERLPEAEVRTFCDAVKRLSNGAVTMDPALALYRSDSAAWKARLQPDRVRLVGEWGLGRRPRSQTF